MRRILLAALSLALVATASPAAGPADSELTSIASELYAMLGAIEAGGDPTPEVREVEEGLYSMTVPLSESVVREWRQTAPKPFQVLMLGHQPYPPGGARSLVTSALVYPTERSNFWFAVINLDGEERIAATVHSIRCPSFKVDRIGDLEYKRAAVTLYWHGSTEPYGTKGQCTEKVRVAGAGRRSARFFVRP
jgi:hypothetical protein